MDLTPQERGTLTAIGLMALVGLAVLAWQRPRPSLQIVSETPLAQAESWNEALTAARQVDINTAGVAELEQLPQVGPALAHRIVAYRQAHGVFGSLAELRQVPGIGPKTYEALQGYVVVE